MTDFSEYIDLGEDEDGAQIYAAIFDTYGFEGIVNLSEMEDDFVIEKLRGNDSPTGKASHTVFMMGMRARFNAQRNVEAWAFKSNNSEQDLWLTSQEAPQELANLIREKGVSVYSDWKSGCAPKDGPKIV